MSDLSDLVHVDPPDEHDARYAEPATPIRPEDLDMADWHLRKLVGLRVEEARVAGVFNREIARIEQRRDDELAKLGRAIDWHEGPLRQLHAAILAADEDAKTVRLPHGNLKSRTPRTPRLRVTDADAFIEWCKANRQGHLVKETPKPDTKALAAELAGNALKAPVPKNGESVPIVRAATGEQIPGVVLELDDTSYSVDLGDWT